MIVVEYPQRNRSHLSAQYTRFVYVLEGPVVMQVKFVNAVTFTPGPDIL